MRLLKRHLIIAAILTVTLLAWLFLGFDRYVGDHEVGVSWQPFLKASPTFQLTFSNPAQPVLDIVSFDNLDAESRIRFSRYCRVRYGTEDVERCYEAIYAARY